MISTENELIWEAYEGSYHVTDFSDLVADGIIDLETPVSKIVDEMLYDLEDHWDDDFRAWEEIVFDSMPDSILDILEKLPDELRHEAVMQAFERVVTVKKPEPLPDNWGPQ